MKKLSGLTLDTKGTAIKRVIEVEMIQVAVPTNPAPLSKASITLLKDFDIDMSGPSSIFLWGVLILR